MSDLIVLNIICFQTRKQLATLNNIGVPLKGVLIDLRACNFVHAKICQALVYMDDCLPLRAMPAHIQVYLIQLTLNLKLELILTNLSE